MKKKSILREWLPPIIYNYLISALPQISFLLKPHPYLHQNATLKNSATKKRAFLIATGPSLKNENLKLLQNEDCFSVSNFFLHEDLQLVHPKMHFFAPYHPPLVLDNFADWLKQADEKLPLDTAMVLGHSDIPLIEARNLFPKRKKYFLQLTNNILPSKVNLEKPVLAPQTGPLMIIPVLLFMGYKEIYLLGCDHTVLRDFKKTINHFYDKEKDSRVNASNSTAWTDIISSHQSSMNVFLQYQLYKDAIQKHYPSVSIVNLSSDSWLDLFPFSTLEEVIKP